MQWTEIPSVAMYQEANWDLLVSKQSGLSLSQAKTQAEADDRITFFFFVNTGFGLSNHGTFSPGDAVFFSGKPWWGGTEGRSNGYVKPAPLNRISTTTSPVGIGWARFVSKIKVPYVTSSRGVIFAWPGLQPGPGPTYQPFENGVLQPVLTFGQGPVPNPNHISAPNKWWTSGQYYGSKLVGGNGWVGGNVMVVNAGDELLNDIKYDSHTKTWTQTVTNLTQSGNPSVSFALSLVHNGSTPQEQNQAIFCLENPLESSLTQCVSIYDVHLTAESGFDTIGQDLADKPYVTKVEAKNGNKELTIKRVMIYNPIVNPISRPSIGK